MLSAMEEAVGSKNLREFIGEPRRCQSIKEYKDAYFAANTLLKALFATSSIVLEKNSLIFEANKLIEKRKKFLEEMFPNSRKGDLLGWAVKEISITEHIKSTYLFD